MKSLFFIFVVMAMTVFGAGSTSIQAQEFSDAAANGTEYYHQTWYYPPDASHYVTIYRFGNSNPVGATYGDAILVHQINSASCRYRIFVRDPTDPDYAFYAEYDNGSGGTLSSATGNSYDDGYWDAVFHWMSGDPGFGDASALDLQMRCGQGTVDSGVAVGTDIRHIDPSGDPYWCGPTAFWCW